MKTYNVYILLCGDQSYYTGITSNLKNRVKQHLDGYNEEAYTYNRQPTMLVFYEIFKYVDLAIAREKQLKGWSRAKKEALINDSRNMLPHLSKKKFRKR